MSILISQQTLKTAGVSLEKQSSGFFTSKILSMKSESLFQISINGKVVDVKSDVALPIGESLRFQWIKGIDGLVLKRLGVLQKETASMNWLNPDEGALFSSKALLNVILNHRELILSKKNLKKLKELVRLKQMHGKKRAFSTVDRHYSLGTKDFSSYQIKKLGILTLFAQKGILLSEDNLENFYQLFFHGYSPENEANSLVTLFNQCRTNDESNWYFMPFDYGSVIKGAFTFCIHSDASCSHFNINWVKKQPSTSDSDLNAICLNPSQRTVGLKGKLLNHGAHLNKWETLFAGLGYRIIENKDCLYDGFESISLKRTENYF